MTTRSSAREYSLAAPELITDPYGGFGRIREEAPVVRGRYIDGGSVWIVTRHDDVGAVLRDPRFASNSASLAGGAADSHAEALVRAGISAELVPYLAGNMVHTDPPDHTRLRGLVSRAFSARRVADLRPRVRSITGALLDGLAGRVAADGTADLIEHFAYPLPITVICELVGVPAADRPRWRAWGADYTSMDPRRVNRMLAEMSSHLGELIDHRRAAPRDDLLTGLIQAHDEDGDRLTDVELVTMVLTLMIAGHETTANLIGNGVAALLTHPDQLALLRDDPGRWPDAVRELLRWCSPVLVAKLRYATEDVTVGGVLVRRGERVQVVLASANHDPRRFPEPEILDVTRRADGRDARHIAYSQGPHYCLGASLANQEAEVALAALFERHPDLTLAVPPDRLEWQPLPGARQLRRLPVRLGTRP
ncbi:cytochrome P450 family protein [Actinomadura geliboluensis]|uniref:cytochrome P450 family protein n=1 Tax=Actinomadura geliboluensis TaxID=882440 RepID=UPI00369E9626